MSNRRRRNPSPTERPVVVVSSSSSSSSSIPYSSDVTYESSCNNNLQSIRKGKENDAEKTKAMPLVGCPQCLMYVMLSEKDPKCPMCKTTSFLDFFFSDDEKSPQDREK